MLLLTSLWSSQPLRHARISCADHIWFSACGRVQDCSLPGLAYRWRWRVGLLPARVELPAEDCNRLRPNLIYRVHSTIGWKPRDGRKDIYRRRSRHDGVAAP